jgi:hypothetical protein
MPNNNPSSKPTDPTWGRSTTDPNAPEVYVLGHRVTEDEVIEQLRDQGDQALADYKSGRLSREEAYRQTANWLRQLWEMQ